jgi:hypothetical protein
VVFTSRLLVPENLCMVPILGYLRPGEKPTIDRDMTNVGIGSVVS